MTGNLYVLVAIAEAIVSFLPTVGTAAARRSRTVVRRVSNCRTALFTRVTASLREKPAGRTHIDAGGPNAACAGEALSR